MIYLPSKIKYKYLFIFLIIAGQLLFMSHVHKQSYYQRYSQSHFSSSSYSSSSSSTDKKLFDSSKLPAIYQSLIKKHSPSKFINYPLDKKCSAYFDTLEEMDENWEVSDLDGMDYSIDAIHPQEYYQTKYEQLKTQFLKDDRNVDNINTNDLLIDLNTKIVKNKIIEEKIINSVSHLRVYGTCYIKNENNNKKRLQKTYHHCSDMETKLFPWLTFEPPIFERWDHTRINNFPIIGNYYHYDGQGELKKNHPSEHANNGKSTCMLAHLKQKFTGKGIVVSIDDHLVPELVKMIKTLRVLHNKLPVQFVHKGDLSDQSKSRLIELARSNIVVRNARTIRDFRQEIWFVDVQNCLQLSYRHKFYQYRNKWLLVLFNSFEEMILMDTDVVSFVAPEQYFKFQGYQRTGAFFFKDRETGHLNRDGVTDFLLKLMPLDLENVFFDIPRLTDFTLKNKFFKNKLYHYMESGIVAMNRNTHLLGLLIAVQLQIWDPIASHTHGDKEIFWLGQSFAGDENYYFNPNLAGAVGKINDKDYKVAKMISGTQPAHIGPDNTTLLWVNSGLETCKKHSWDNDYHMHLKMSEGFKSVEELKQYYLSPLLIEAAIIPPDGANIYPNGENEPDKGWRQLEFDGCDGYLWGAYSLVGGNTFSHDPATHGKVIQFGEDEVAMFKEVGLVWINEDYYFGVDKPKPSATILDKYWRIMDKFGHTLDYEKLVNVGRSQLDGGPWERWDDNDELKLLVDEQPPTPNSK